MPSKGTLGEVQLLCRDTVIFRDVVKEAIIMAEVQIKPQIHELVSQGASSPVVQRPKMPAKVPDQISPAEEKLNKLRMEEAAKNDDIRTKEYGPVIAKSSDGDTVRVKKNDIEEQISEVRAKILQGMESHCLDKIQSEQFSVSYSPAKTVMQFDSRAFRFENEDLYMSYCKPKQRESSIVVKRNIKE